MHSGRRGPLSYREIADCVDRDLGDDMRPSEKQLDAAINAAEHLLAIGLPPLFSVDTIRALWRRDRELSESLAKLAGVA
jgi:hypothetical protein